ncbi:MAG: PEP-CTERM sorting domain-containing protein [Chitinophagia bacterium]|nr:PEP-CTERM sorting domain-containing protein [Chitinophagia bacterium]
MSVTFIRTNAMPWIAMAAMTTCSFAQGTIGGGGELQEDDGVYVYRNAPVPLAFDRDVSSTLEIGEDLALGGLNRVLMEITFNYRSDYTQTRGMVVAVYAEGGPDSSGLFVPTVKLLERSVDVRSGGGIGTVALGYSLANTMPDRVVVSVRFVDVPTGGTISLVAQASDPTIGDTRPGYLERTGPGNADWALRPLTDNSGNQVNFLLRVKAAPIPEPTSIALGVFGLGLVFYVSRRRAG